MSNWSPQEGPQTEVLLAEEDEVLFGGARGGGKTEGGLAWLANPKYIAHPRYSALVIRRGYEDLGPWVERARHMYSGTGAVIGGNPVTIKWPRGGITRIGYWKDADTLGKYLGNEYQKILVEEITQTIETEKEYKMLLGSLRSTIPELKTQFLGTTNPGGAGHAWVKKYWVNCARNKRFFDPITGKSRLFIPSKVTDNKILCEVDPGYVKYLEGLPENLRKAWLEGDWDLSEGQFFTDFGTHMKEQPFVLPADAGSQIFGSLDIGIGHYTSFGLWWMDSEFTMHRLFSYKANGYTHQFHAEAIFERIAGFKWSNGAFPIKIFVGHDAWNKSRLNGSECRAPIDEYTDVFSRAYGDSVAAKRVFEKALTERRNGCAIMREVMATKDGQPGLMYFDVYNQSFEDDMPAAQVDENDPEQYVKKDGAAWDDTVDEARYGFMGMYTYRAKQLQRLSRGPRKPFLLDQVDAKMYHSLA